MRKVETIIKDLRNQIYWSQPNMRFNELTNLVNELENTLSHSEALIEEPVVEVVEETVVEEPIVKMTEEVVEETVVEELTTTKTSTKKK